MNWNGKEEDNMKLKAPGIPYYANPGHSRVLFLEEKRQLFHIDQDLPCYPFWYEYVIREDNAVYQSGPVAYAMFIIGLEGVSHYTVAGTDYAVLPETLLFIPEFTPFRNSSNGRITKCLLEVKGSNLTSLLATFNLREIKLFQIRGHMEFVREMRQIAEKLGSRNEDDFLDAMGMTYQFLARLSFLQQKEKGQENFLQKILEFLEQDFSRAITLNDLCSAMKMSPSTLTRLTKHHLGFTPMQYRARRKLERATYYLYMKEMTIKEIAYRLGYCNPFHFSREFKRFTGLSPIAYRAESHLLREIGRDVDNREKP